MSDFSKNLCKELSTRGIKQVRLADAIGVPPTTVNGWTRGAHEPDIDTLMAICNFLGVQVGYMIGDPRNITEEDLQYFKDRNSEKASLLQIQSDREKLKPKYTDVVKALVEAGVKEVVLKL